MGGNLTILAGGKTVEQLELRKDYRDSTLMMCTTPGGYSRFQVTGMIEGFFWSGKFGKVFFRGSLIKVGIFGGIPNYLNICDSYTYFVLSGNFYGSEIWCGSFWGLNFGRGIFLGFVWNARVFLGFWFLPPFDHPSHLKSRYSPWGTTQIWVVLLIGHAARESCYY